MWSPSLPGDGICTEHRLHVRKPGPCFLVIEQLLTYENLQLLGELLELCLVVDAITVSGSDNEKFNQLDCVWGQLGSLGTHVR